MFSYRLLPTKKQVHALTQTLEECRWLYNHLLAERRDAKEAIIVPVASFRSTAI